MTTHRDILCPSCRAYLTITVEPARATHTTKTHPEDADTVTRWAATVPADVAPMTSGQLFEAFESWCRSNGVSHYLTKRGLTSALAARGWTYRRTGKSGGRHYVPPRPDGQDSPTAPAPVPATDVDRSTWKSPTGSPIPAGAPVRASKRHTPRPSTPARTRSQPVDRGITHAGGSKPPQGPTAAPFRDHLVQDHDIDRSPAGPDPEGRPLNVKEIVTSILTEYAGQLHGSRFVHIVKACRGDDSIPDHWGPTLPFIVEDVLREQGWTSYVDVDGPRWYAPPTDAPHK